MKSMAEITDVKKYMETREDRWKYLGFDDRWFVLIGIPVVGFLMPVLFFRGWIDSWEMFKFHWLESTIHVPFYWFFLRYLMIRLRKKYDQFEQTSMRIMIQVVFVLVLGLVIGNLVHHILFQQVICDVFTSLTCSEMAEAHHPLLATYFTCFFVMLTYEAIYFYDQLRRSILEKEAAKQAQIHSELESLRNQVNPHFLFNSMNTLMNLVMEDQKIAVSFLRKLSKVYRYVLENREDELVPLQKELDFIYSYVFLQKERFKENLDVAFDIPESYLSHQIIPLSLQILFENAIKHNIASRKKPLKIKVFVAGDKLIVQNNLQRKEQVMHSTKVGLENIKTRYQYFTKETVQIEETSAHFMVHIPLITSTAVEVTV